jgi:hypothetical protein
MTGFSSIEYHVQLWRCIYLGDVTDHLIVLSVLQSWSSSFPPMSRTSSSTTTLVSPSKSTPLRVKPNPHPYAIKTTSTGILSGSHSVTSTTQSPYHYVPSSPSPSPTKPTHAHGRGSKHRYSRSLTSDELPRPLPVPPSPSDDDCDVFQSSLTRPETLPLSLTSEPTNPKQWNPSELASYLASTLDSDSGQEIIAFIENSEITGMSFLRFDDGVLNA